MNLCIWIYNHVIIKVQTIELTQPISGVERVPSPVLNQAHCPIKTGSKDETPRCLSF